ncbi:forkhead box protein N2 isoform X1 [Clarias gariepinus]|uniref:forkhead box protein N2 isoform X1 n=1 Tax=Clarias gariepinus TaxID=13013 RepID=UPI00234DC359|nr:forkhead box protein N2 isoform X1 [Clarias gariepinus]XP_053361824.1 forkhead box protein N2 isoform X1 [Clarias gariepinus]
MCPGAGSQMEDHTHTLPSLSSIYSPANPAKALSLSSSLSQPSSTVPASLPLFPSPPQSPPFHLLQSSGRLKLHCLTPSTPSDQDDLTCLNWLHQKNLLPLSKMPLLPQFEPPPISNLPSSPGKPPYSFSSLIFMAIEDSPEKRLPVRAIYEWIVNNFPYYRTAPRGWRNSVRHNLSLSKSFCRMQRDRSHSIGKGSLWCICPEYRPALLEVLKKTHYCHSTNSNLLNNPVLLEAANHGRNPMCDTTAISDLDSNSQSLSSDTPCSLLPEHEELVAIQSVELTEESEKDPLADSGYIEFHYYQCEQYQYLVLPGNNDLDLGTVEILQLDAEAQEAAGSLLDLAGGNH